jgi:hypothetical protein
MRDKAEIVSYGISQEQGEHGSADGQLALDDYLGETPHQGKYKFIARCTRCSIRFHYTKDV